MWTSGRLRTTGKHIEIKATGQVLLTSNDQPDVSLLYKGEKFPNLRIITVRISNVGTKGMNGIAGNKNVSQPIRFSFSKAKSELLGASVNRNPTGVKVKRRLIKEKDKLVVEFDVLNKKNYFSLNIFYSASQKICPKVDGKFKDISRNELNTLKNCPLQERQGLFPFWWPLLIIMGVSVLIMILSVFRNILGKVKYEYVAKKDK